MPCVCVNCGESISPIRYLFSSSQVCKDCRQATIALDSYNTFVAGVAARGRITYEDEKKLESLRYRFSQSAEEGESTPSTDIWTRMTNVFCKDVAVVTERLDNIRTLTRLRYGPEPHILEDYVGQDKSKQIVDALLTTAVLNHLPMDHILICGEAGIGKRTFARCIAGDMGGEFYEESGHSLNTGKTLQRVLDDISYTDVLFIEDIGVLSISKTKMLCDVLDNGNLGETTIEPFTVIGSTEQMQNVGNQLKERIIQHIYLEPYSEQEMLTFLKNSAVPIHAAPEIVKYTKGSPRRAVELVRRIDDQRQAEDLPEITPDLCARFFESVPAPEISQTAHYGTADWRGEGFDPEVIRTLQDAHKLTPQGFEDLVKWLFEGLGYLVATTSGSHDGGIDLFLEKEGKTELVQCKRYQGNVSVETVREFFGVMVDKQVTKGYVVTTGNFTLTARQFAEGKGIHLVDGSELAEVIASIAGDT